MRIPYDKQEDYDRDKLSLSKGIYGGVNEPLPAATLIFDDDKITVDPMWSRPKVGGYLTIEGGRYIPYTIGVGDVTPKGMPHWARIASIIDNVITMEVGGHPPGSIEVTGDACTFHVPPMRRLPGSMPAGRRISDIPAWSTLVRVASGLSRTPLLKTHSLAVVGCAFGWDVEIMRGEGYTNIVGVETSAYVHANLNVSYEPQYRIILESFGLDPDQGEGADILAAWMVGGRTTATILNEDISTVSGRQAVWSHFGVNEKLDFVITPQVLSILDDEEIKPFNEACFALADNVIHYVNLELDRNGVPTVGRDPVMNWKTHVEWKVLTTPATVITSDFKVM